MHPIPIVDAGPDRHIVIGNPVILNGKTDGEQLVYSWSPNNNINYITKLTPTVSPLQNIAYTLSATSLYGCSNADSVLVKVVNGLFIPTAFTPNGDGKNDEWKIPFLDPAYEATVSVFNRYGKLIYHATSDIISWDGRFHGVLQSSGTYVYTIHFKANKLILKGTVTIIK